MWADADTPACVLPARIEPLDFLTSWLTPAGDLWVLNPSGPHHSATEYSPLTMRRHDWPGSNSGPEGYQASDAFLTFDGLAETTWSYSPFASFNAAHGDGGEIYTVESDVVRIVGTQDGAKPGFQPFTGATGWVLFDVSNLPTGHWADTVASLWNNADGPHVGDVQAYTRWRLETVDVPFLVGGVRVDRELPAVISEHYDAATIDGATAMERSIFAEGVGRVVWESWTKGTPVGQDLDMRMPGTDWSAPPAEGWHLNDGRTSTNVVALDEPWHGYEYGWNPTAPAWNGWFMGSWV